MPVAKAGVGEISWLMKAANKQVRKMEKLIRISRTELNRLSGI